jgi:hypothetical protein
MVRSEAALRLVWCEFRDTVNLQQARFSRVILSGSTLTCGQTPAINGDGLVVEGDLFLTAGFTASGAGKDGTVRLMGAHVGGHLDLSGAQISNTGDGEAAGPALVADSLLVDGEVFLIEGFEASGAGKLGTVRLPGAHIGGQMNALGAEIRNTGDGEAAGPALYADRLVVDGNLVLTAGFEASGAGKDGTVRLPGAHIGGQLIASGAQISNTGDGEAAGPALIANILVVDGSLLLTAGFTASGAGEDGTIRLAGAHIGGQMNASGAQISNTGDGEAAGPAMDARDLVVDSGLFLTEGFTASGAGKDGTIRLPGAHIGAQLDLFGAEISNTGSGEHARPALNGEGMTVGGSLLLDTASVTAEAPVTALNLSGCQVGGGLTLSPTRFSATNLVNFDGLTFTHTPPGSPAEWITILRDATPYYAAQPYQHLAARYVAEGHTGYQRDVMVAQQDDRRDRVLRDGLGDAHGRAWWRLRTRLVGLWFSRWVVGYGYRPWRAAWWLLGIIAAATVLSVGAAHTHAGGTGQHVAFRPAERPGGPPADCSAAEQFGLALRLSVPLIGNVTEGNCQITTSHRPGGWFAAAGFSLQAASWATATLVVAGYAGIIRRL